MTTSLLLKVLLYGGIPALLVLLAYWALREAQRRDLLVFALTLFVSACLLFLVQPMIGKLLLPYLGGSPAVWNTCMVFFQALLLAGYAYAHLLTRIQDHRKQLLIHGLLLLLPLLPLFLLQFDVAPLANFWSPPSDTSPIPWLLTILLIIAGLPFFVVSATAPLLQKWFSNTDHPDAKDPYFLYGASNIGSMGALLLYPAWVESAMTLSEQRLWWSICYIGLAALILLAGAMAVASTPARKEPELVEGPQMAPPVQTDGASDEGRIPTWFDRVRWVLLAFVPSSVMLGCTTHMTTDIAAVPLLWILPLALYLASFILVFSRLPMWLSITVALLGPIIIIGSVSVTPFQFDAEPMIKEKWILHGDWAAWYQYGQHILNMPLRHLNMHHLILLALIGIVVACCFRSPQTIHTLVVVLAPLACLTIGLEKEVQYFFRLQWFERILLHLGVLFVVALVCHGELARTRPRTRYLTEFYLLMSVGGVLGGIFNSLIAPVVYDRVWEYPLVIAFMLLLMPWPGTTNEKGWEAADSWTVVGFGTIMGVLLLGLFAIKVTWQQQAARIWVRDHFSDRFQTLGDFLARQLPDEEGPGDISEGGWTPEWKVLYRERNFFGSFTVTEYTRTNRDGRQDVYHTMFHGTTTHGFQNMSTTDAAGVTRTDTRARPLSYFHEAGPIGDLFADRERLKRPLKMAVIGVGTGTLAAYTQKDWELTLYEIDPAVVKVARDPKYFSYIDDAEKRGVKVDVILGDGRQEFKKAPEGHFDLIFMDAFTSDAIPLHLLTAEAADMYMEKLAPGGLIIYNIANRHLDFEPVLANLCASDKRKWTAYRGVGEEEHMPEDAVGNVWIVIGRHEEDLGLLPYHTPLDKEGRAIDRWKEARPDKKIGLWTDDYANLLKVFRWSH
jgi:spermidine synthase